MPFVFSMLLLFLTLASSALADRWCALKRNPVCSASFVPGHRGMGPTWWAIGRPQNNILHLITTLKVGKAPSPEEYRGTIAINTAMENSNIWDYADTNPPTWTYQTMTALYPRDYQACEQPEDHWCTFPSSWSKPNITHQYTGMPYAQASGSEIPMIWHYGQDVHLTDPNRPYWMFMAINDRPGIALNAHQGESKTHREVPWQWWPKTECLCSSSGLIPAHSYFGTRVRIDPPSMDYGATISNQSSSHTEPYTTDNGLHWFIDRIDMEDSWCENNDPCPDPEDVQSGTVQSGSPAGA